MRRREQAGIGLGAMECHRQQAPQGIFVIGKQAQRSGHADAGDFSTWLGCWRRRPWSEVVLAGENSPTANNLHVQRAQRRLQDRKLGGTEMLARLQSERAQLCRRGPGWAGGERIHSGNSRKYTQMARSLRANGLDSWGRRNCRVESRTRPSGSRPP